MYKRQIRARTLLDAEQIDVAVVNMDFYNLDKYNNYVMMEDRYVYCVSKTHRYADKHEITTDMLKDESIILFNTDSVQTQTVTTRLRSAGITPRVRMYCSQLATVLNYARGGNCGAFLYSSIAVNPRDFVEIPVTPEITSKFGIIWKKGVFVPDQLSKFVTFVKSYDTVSYTHLDVYKRQPTRCVAIASGPKPATMRVKIMEMKQYAIP